MRKISLFLVGVFLLLLSGNLFAQTFTIGYLTYSVSGSEVTVSSVSTSAEGDLVIPSTVTNNDITYSVTKIGSYAFMSYYYANRTGITSLTIPNSLTSISSDFFGTGTGGLQSISVEEGNTTYSSQDGILYNYAKTTMLCCPPKKTGSVTIPSSVTSIGTSHFRDCSSLQSISVEEGNTTYSSQDGILYNYDKTTLICCPRAKAGSVTIPNNVTSIGDRAFEYCRGLTSITIPSSVTSIGNQAFQYCSAVTDVTFTSTTPPSTIATSSFKNMATGVTTFHVPTGTVDAYKTALNWENNGYSEIYIITDGDEVLVVTENGINYAILDAENHTAKVVVSPNASGDITIASSVSGFGSTTAEHNQNYTVTSIGDSAFSGRAGLTSVTIPSSVTSIGNSAFRDCSALTSVTIPNSVTSIGNYAFRECRGLTSITIPSSVTSIGYYAFSYCTGLTSVTIGTGVTSIGDCAFSNCSGLTSITIPSSVTSIGQRAFEYCSGLTSITIPSSVTSIGSYAFAYSGGLTSVTMEGTTPPEVSTEDAYIFPTSNTGFKIYVPCGSKTNYTSATYWRTITSYITDAFPTTPITEDKYLASCDCDFPSTITIKDGASLSAADYSALSTELSGKTVNVEKELTIDEFSLIGHIGGATNYSFISRNTGNSSGLKHSMVALPFYYEGNSWGVDADGNGARNGTNTPSYGESFFVYPTTNQYNTDGTPINGDTYTTLTESISSSNLKLSDFTVSLTNDNTTKWFALSNPFIGKLNLSKFYTSNNDVLQSTYAYVWDNTAHDWVALDGINTTNKYALYPATGILIEGKGTSANATFKFNVADIVTTEPITTTKSAQANRVEFTATSNDVAMKMYAHIDESSDNGYGRMDASVLFSNKEDAVNPYFALEGRNIFDNYFSSLPATFDVNFNAYKSNTIDFAVTQGMEDVEVTLIDIANANAETVLNVNEPVSIDVTAGQNEGRYQLRFSKKNVGINEVASEENTIQIWNNNSEVTINGKDLKRVEIYNTLGQRVYSSSLSGESTAFDSKLNAGAYIVKVYTANSSKSEKIIIR